MASSRPSIRVVKHFNYRGATRAYSNRYYFTGTTPPDATHWTTFSDNVVAAEKAMHFALANGGCQIVETFGYDSGSEIPVFSKTYTTDGTLAAAGVVMPGDVAGLLRYSTNARSSRNHPIYMFNYYHGVASNGNALTPDTWVISQANAAGAYGTAWVSTGFSDGAVTHKRTSPSGHDATGIIVELQLTHRDLPR